MSDDVRLPGAWATFRVLLARIGRVETRSRDTTVTTLTIGLLVALVGNVAYADRVPAALAVPGIVWTAVVFAAQVGLARSFVLDRDRGTYEAVLTSPAGTFPYFAAKLVANLGVLLLVTATVALAATLFLPVDVTPARLPWLGAVVLAGAVGIATVTTLAAAIAMHGRHWVLLVPLLSLPALFPVVATAVPATQVLLSATADATAIATTIDALRVLVAFDVVFATAAWMLSPFLLEP